jgi:nucleoside-diphosphate-sugar epimerase
VAKTRVLVTGLSGFTGPHLRAELQAAGYETFGPPEHALDILDKEALHTYIGREPFDYVVHLAGISHVAHEHGAGYYQVNLVGTLNLLEAIARRGAPPKKIILASSAQIYGRPARSPVDESTSPAPLNHYGASKYGTYGSSACRFS